MLEDNYSSPSTQFANLKQTRAIKTEPTQSPQPCITVDSLSTHTNYALSTFMPGQVYTGF